MRRFPVDRLTATEITLDGPTSHHLLRVVGIARGERVEIFDGHGARARAELIDVRDGTAVLRITERLLERRGAERHVVLGVVRPTAMEIVVRMGTELGLTHLWPVWTERTVRRTEKTTRWTRIAESAAAQCGRSDTVQVAPPTPLVEALDSVGEVRRFVAAPSAASRLPGEPGPAAILIGPEGGLTEDELRAAHARGFESSRLGDNVLRSETAAVVALALIGSG